MIKRLFIGAIVFLILQLVVYSPYYQSILIV